MTSAPAELHDVATSFVTTEFVTIDAGGQPIVWPLTPYRDPDDPDCVDVTTGVGYPKKAKDAERNPNVALLFSDPTGCGMTDPPAVLVQGTARVDDADLKANAERYLREAAAKLPKAAEKMPPKFLVMRFMAWYVARLYIHVVPRVVWVWPGGDQSASPRRVAVDAAEATQRAPLAGASPAPDRPAAWDDRMAELGTRYPTAVVATVEPSGFPFAVRVGVRPDPAARVVRLLDVPDGLPLAPGPACLAAHDHDADFTYQRNFQVRGELRREDDGWLLVPHKLVGGFELPPGSPLAKVRVNAKKVRRFRKIAKREMAART
jgi:hypothetical protein